MRVLNFIFGFLIGAVLGAGIVLLITPQSGQDLQQSTRGKLDSLLAEGRKAFDTRKADLENRMATIQTGLGS